MKNIILLRKYFIGLSLLLILLFVSCEKVVTLDLKNANQQVVVQGNVSNQTGPYVVYLNYSVPFYSDNTFPVLSGALVKISDNAGNNETLSEASPGVYKTNLLAGTPGRTYNLQITANNNNYFASSTMANPIAIDSFVLHPTYSKPYNILNGYRVVCKFTDPAGVGNFYRIVIHSNDSSALGSRTSRIISDKLVDGQQLSATFGTKLLSLDTVKVQLQCIDRNTYDFYNTLNNAIGNTGAGQFLASLPANPTNNISNKGLGYFAAYSITTQTIIVP